MLIMFIIFKANLYFDLEKGGNMIVGLKEVLTEFSEEIKSNYPDYASLYNYFNEYIDQTYYTEESSIKEFLGYNLCKRDIVNSCVYYAEQSNATSVSAIEKYLNSMTKLYNSYIKPHGYDNKGLEAIVPFSSYKDEVRDKIKKKELAEKNNFPALSEEGFNTIIEFLERYQKKTYVGMQISIIFKLILLYGFKLERIKYLQVGDYEENDNTLSIVADEDLDVKSRLILELPTYLSNEIKNYLGQHEKKKNEYMFLNRQEHVVEPSFFSYTFRAIEDKYCIKEKSFTTTGLAKYAIKNMIREGIGSADIKLITGMEDIVIDDCEMSVRQENVYDIRMLNRKINSKIRGIKTFDNMKIKEKDRVKKNAIKSTQT